VCANVHKSTKIKCAGRATHPIISREADNNAKTPYVYYIEEFNDLYILEGTRSYPVKLLGGSISAQRRWFLPEPQYE
jgi:hypothetical protein